MNETASSTAPDVCLVKPSLDSLPGYVDAVQRGWQLTSFRTEEVARENLDKIAKDPQGFVASLDDREAKGDPVVLPDGRKVPRLPGYHRWIWDGEFCGTISLRWQPGSAELPPHCLGHIGYMVVPWRQRKGYATAALGLILPEAMAVGLPSVYITTDPSNLASQRVIEANGGVLVERFKTIEAYGAEDCLRYRIELGAR